MSPPPSVTPSIDTQPQQEQSTLSAGGSSLSGGLIAIIVLLVVVGLLLATLLLILLRRVRDRAAQKERAVASAVHVHVAMADEIESRGGATAATVSTSLLASDIGSLRASQAAAGSQCCRHDADASPPFSPQKQLASEVESEIATSVSHMHERREARDPAAPQHQL